MHIHHADFPSFFFLCAKGLCTCSESIALCISWLPLKNERELPTSFFPFLLQFKYEKINRYMHF